MSTIVGTERKFFKHAVITEEDIPSKKELKRGNFVDLKTVKKVLPEYNKILEMAGGHKPRKFVENIKIVDCPTVYNPSGLGDYAYRTSYLVDKDGIHQDVGYSYDTMMSSGVKPVDRMVDVPRGSRMWIVTYDGIWGGHWEVLVFIHKDDKQLMGLNEHSLWIKKISKSALTENQMKLLGGELK